MAICLSWFTFQTGSRWSKELHLFQVSDVCKAEARIFSVVNTDVGKVVKVNGYMYRGVAAVMQPVPSFLYCGRFSDFQNVFGTTEELDYIADLERDADVRVIQSKDWFGWCDASKPLQAGTRLIFRIQSQVFFKDRTSYRVTGKVPLVPCYP
jgi:fatty acid synthase subunit alpha